MSAILELSYVVLKKNLDRLTVNLLTITSEPHDNVLSTSVRSLSYLTADELANIVRNANNELAYLGLTYVIQNNTLIIKRRL